MSDRAPSQTSLRAVSASDVGSVRTENQDAAAIVPLPGELGLIVADGMGGHAGGGEAADGAVAAVIEALRSAPADSPAAERINAAVAAAHAAVADLRARIKGSPGTTLVVALLADDGSYTVGNIGDSRAYLLSAGAAEALTADHSWVAEQVRQGSMAPEDARNHMRRNIITRAVMGDGERADITTGALRDGDVLLLCSDGVWEPLSDAQLAAAAGAVARDQSAQHVCDEALRAGSRDNVTAVVAWREAP